MPLYNDSQCDELWKEILDSRKSANEVARMPEAETYYAAKNRRDKAQADVDAFNQGANQRQQTVDQLKNNLDSIEKDLAEIRDQFTSTHGQAGLKAEALKSAQETHAADVAALQAKADELKQAADTLQQIEASNDGTITVAVAGPGGGVIFEKVQVGDAFVVDAKQKRDQLQTEYNDLMAVADHSQTQVSSLEKAIAELNDGQVKIRQTTAEMESEAAKTKKEIEDKESENASYIPEWEHLQQELEDARDESAVAQEAYEEAKKRIDQDSRVKRMNDLQDEYWANCQFRTRRHFNGSSHGAHSVAEPLQCWCGQNHGPHNLVGLTQCWCGVMNNYIGHPH